MNANRDFFQDECKTGIFFKRNGNFLKINAKQGFFKDECNTVIFYKINRDFSLKSMQNRDCDMQQGFFSSWERVRGEIIISILLKNVH